MDSPKNAPTDKRLANLKPAWEPGQSGNPDGKPPGTISLRTILKAKLAEVPEGDDRRTLAERLVDSTCRAALAGDTAARKLVWESIDGKAKESIELSTVIVDNDDIDYGRLSTQTLHELNEAIDKARRESDGASE